MADGDTEQIDDFVSVRPDQMRAENPAALFLDERLIAVYGFADPPCRVPVGHLGGIYFQPRRLLARRAFGKTNGGNRWKSLLSIHFRARGGAERHGESGPSFGPRRWISFLT